MNNELRKGESKIYRAILKYGLENFSLTILEYCEPSKCLEREDDYFKLLKAENNILFKKKKKLGLYWVIKSLRKAVKKMSDAQKGTGGE
jgi:group I intron endonuclease